MIIVANKMSEIAVASSNPNDADAFGRSAFNRYYYASYLIIREMLKRLNRGWSQSPHRGIPDLLEGTIINQIRNILKKQKTHGLVSPGQAAGLRTSANIATAELANLLRVAYEVRLVADYEPEVKIKQNGRSMVLFDHTLHEAQSWPIRASFLSKEIMRIWRALGL
jgi:hypothetical protein